MTVLVDSNILIDVARAINTQLVSAWLALSKVDAAVLYSPVGVTELRASARPKEHDALNNLFSALTCLPIDENLAREAGHYVRRYQKSHSVELADALVAASAVAAGADLWTRNRKHYPMKELRFFEP